MEGAAKKTHSLSSGTVTADQAATLKWMKQIWKAHLCLSFSHFLTVRYHHPNGFIVVWEVCERGTRLLLLLNAVINKATMKMIQPNCVRVCVFVCRSVYLHHHHHHWDRTLSWGSHRTDSLSMWKMCPLPWGDWKWAAKAAATTTAAAVISEFVSTWTYLIRVAQAMKY